MTQVEMVKEAMLAGHENLDDIAAFLKKHFRVEMLRSRISTAKCAAKKDAPGYTTNGVATVNARPSNHTDHASPEFLLSCLDGIKTLRGLLGKHGHALFNALVEVAKREERA